jgi:hypothetical protein
MRRKSLYIAAGLICRSLLAQTQPGVMSYQPAQSFAAGPGPGGRGVLIAMPRMEGGRPFSATVNTQTVRTLSDGTHVSQTTTMLQYRDSEGRVRTETSQPGSSLNIQIHDPVAGVRYQVDPVKKSAVKRAAGIGVPAPAVGRAGRGGDAATDTANLLARLKAAVEAVRATAARRSDPNLIEEDLGTMTINGVTARGTRITTVVPVGAIGNDREFRSVDERWFSPDLNLLVRSISSDPRFGTTNYEMTNIRQEDPDPGLFRVPADYSIVSN